MKKTLLCLALAFCATAHADDLSDAVKAFDAKNYPQALKLFTKLDAAKNAEGSYRLGEMYWYGEAGSVDEAKAKSLFEKAAAAGHKKAIAALDTMKKRGERKADIDFWITKYDGSELKSGKYRCPAPRIPQVSKSNDEIQVVKGKVDAWQDCYNAFANNLNAQTPPAKRIPQDLLDLMNKEELEAAVKHIEQVQSGIAENANVNAKFVLADFDAWRTATEAYVADYNKTTKQVQSNDRSDELDQRKNNYVPKTK